MEMALGQLAGLLRGELTDPTKAGTKVSNVAALDSAGPGEVAFLWKPEYAAKAATSNAEAIVTAAPIEGRTCVVVSDPEAAMLTLLGMVYAAQRRPAEPTIHATAFVSPEATLGEGVSVGPHAVIEAGATIGPRTRIYARAYVGPNVTLGEDCAIHPNATVLDLCRLGDRVTVWSGAVIGKDGFGFAQRGGKHVRIPQIGTVVIEDDVEIGALSTVARGAIEDTVIHRGVIVDDHCHIAHGCDIGEYSVLVGRTAMGGSVKIGKHCFLLQDSGISTGRTVGDGAMLGSCSRVFYKDVPAGAKISFVANTHNHVTTKKVESMLPRLPEMRLRLKRLEKKVDAILADS